MRYLFSVIVLNLIFFSSSCQGIKSKLVYAKGYELVAEDSLILNTKNRTAKEFWIISDATTVDELAQTSMLAAYELNKKYKNDLTLILLIPSKEMIRTNYYYT